MVDIVVILLAYFQMAIISNALCDHFEVSGYRRMPAIVIISFSLYTINFHFLGYVSLILPGIPLVRMEIQLILLGIEWFFCRLLCNKPFEPKTYYPPKRGILSLLNWKYSYDFFILVVLLFIYISVFVVGLSRPPVGYDALWYHLPNAAWFLKSHTLNVAFGPAVNTFPGNAQLYFMPYMAISFDHILNLLQFPFAIFLAAVVYMICRLEELDGHTAFRFVMLSLFTPIVVFQAMFAYDILIFTFFVVGSLAFLFDYYKHGNEVSLAISGLSGGFALGVKYLGIYSLAILAVLLFINTKGRRPRPLMIFVFFSFLTSSFWYVRNFLRFHNPVYPYEVKLFGWPGLDGFSLQRFEYVDNLKEWLWYPIFGNFSHESGIGMGGIFLYSAIIFAVIVLFRKTYRNRCIFFHAVFLVLSCLLWWFSYHRAPRYLLAAIILFYPFAGQIYKGMKTPHRTIASGLILVLVSFTVYKIMYVFTGSNFELSYHRKIDRSSFYGVGDFIDRIDKPALILNMWGQYQNYPLMGSYRQHNVLEGGSWYDTSFDNLKKDGVEYVFFRGAQIQDHFKNEPRILEVYRSIIDDHGWYNWHEGLMREYVQIYKVK